MKAAFQGVHGAYSEVALKRLLGEGCASLPRDTFDQVFRAVETGAAERGVIPIENSLAGSIHQNYDLLVAHRLHIVAETHLRVEHVLMCHPTTDLRRLRQVRSHPQALAQCSRFFAGRPGVKPVVWFDTAGAAQSLRDEAPEDTGAIASEYAARLYGLKVLRRNLENEAHNFTRFLVIARKPAPPGAGAPAKTSVAFTPAANRVGVLFRMLGVFALRDIDLLKIESRPDPGSAFAYRFYLDLAGSPREPKVAKALDHLRELAGEFRLLGAYARGDGDLERNTNATAAEGPRGRGRRPGRKG